MILPLVLLFFLHLGSCMEMLRLHGRLAFALWQTGRELTVYGAAVGEDEEGGGVPGLAVSYLYVDNRLEQILGRDYLDSSPLTYGSQGLNYLASEYLEDEETVNIIITYQVSPRITIFPFPYFRMVSRYYGRAWTGYEVGEETEQTIYVYVTDEGEVWHSRADCSYLKLSIYEAAPETVWMLRNRHGERYRACSRCEDWPVSKRGTVTIPSEAVRPCCGIFGLLCGRRISPTAPAAAAAHCHKIKERVSLCGNGWDIYLQWRCLPITVWLISGRSAYRRDP